MLKQIQKYFSERVDIGRAEKKNAKSEVSITIATCALLLEMAHSDDDFSNIEKKGIISILKKEYNLSDSDANELLQLAELERTDSLDLWQFTNLINKSFNVAEKQKVIEILWHVIFADGKVDQYEEQLIRKLSYLLNIDHSVMIEAKIKVKNKLNI